MKNSKYIITAILLTFVLSNFILAQPDIAFKPTILKFGFVSIDGTHQRDITLVNIGDAPANIDSCSIAEPFAIEPVEGVVIPPGDSVTFSIDFNPLAVQYLYRTIDFFYNDLESSFIVQARGIPQFEAGEIIWTADHINDVVCVLSGDDYNDDGFPDLFAEGYDLGASGDPLVCLSGSGNNSTEQIWSSTPYTPSNPHGGNGDRCLAEGADFNDDGVTDILRGGAWSSRTVFAIDGSDGESIWWYSTYSEDYSGWIYSVALTEDVDDDGTPDVLASAGSHNNKAYCFDGANGVRLWSYGCDDAVSSIASLDDVNNDNIVDAVCATFDVGIYVYCISGASVNNGVRLWRYNVGHPTHTLAVINDLNDDGIKDAIAGTWGTGILALSGQSETNAGELIWHTPMAAYVNRVVACPDLDNDGYDDILAATWSDFVFALSGVDGSVIWVTPTYGFIWSIDYINDINDDGVIDVVAGDENGYVYLISGADGERRAAVTDLSTQVLTLRGAGDVNGDSYDDYIAGTKLETDIGGQVFLIAGGPGGPVVGIDEVQTALPQDYISVSNYPNPFNSSTIIKFILPQDGSYKFSVYDIRGRLVDQLEGSGNAGPNSVLWDAKAHQKFASGVYFYSLKSGDQTGNGRMLYLK